MIKRILSTTLAFVLIAVCVLSTAAPAYATPNTHPNTYVNTGNQRADIIGVAATQVGYLEGPNNDTKYGVWYGINNLGWCGIFVAWCAEQAGVPTSVLRRTGVASPEAFGVSVKPEGYIPISGDLFFARDNSHVGLVYYVEGEYFYSLEGNTYQQGPEGVYIRKHKLDAVKYASPNYQGSAGHKYVKKIEDAHPHKVTYVCSDCGSSYATGATTTLDSCLQCRQANCSHKFGGWKDISQDQHNRTCSACGLIESKNHQWNKETVITEATCSTAGSKSVACSGCGATKTLMIPATGQHVFSNWAKVDDKTHSRTCSFCDKKEIKAHSVGGNWSSNEFEHWHGCSLCGEKFSSAEHKFGTACDSPCEICNYVSPEGHHFSTQWTTDSQMHWKTCSGCDIKGSESAHAFENGCDRICDVCGYERHVDHIFSDSLSHDGFNHWIECTVCGLRKDSQEHVKDENARPGAMISCDICDAQLTSEEEHIHGYDEVLYDSLKHWGKCSCGQEMEKESHKWSMKSGSCSVCGVKHDLNSAESGDDFQDLLPWIYIGGGAILLCVVLLIVIIILKKRRA